MENPIILDIAQAVQLIIKLNGICIHDHKVNRLLEESHNISSSDLSTAIEKFLDYEGALLEELEKLKLGVFLPGGMCTLCKHVELKDLINEINNPKK